jgi:hypothetical protein
MVYMPGALMKYKLLRYNSIMDFMRDQCYWVRMCWSVHSFTTEASTILVLWQRELTEQEMDAIYG